MIDYMTANDKAWKGMRIASPPLGPSLVLYTHSLNFKPRYSKLKEVVNRAYKSECNEIPHYLECDECFQVWVMSKEVAVKRTKRGVS